MSHFARRLFAHAIQHRSRWLSAGLCLAGAAPLAAASATPAVAQDWLADSTMNVGSSLYEGGPESQQGQALGTAFRVGHFTGPWIGREDSITPVELMPYGFVENFMLFGDIRGFRSNSDRYGANLGGGARYYLENFDRIIGGNAYFDYDATSGASFRDVGFGFETLGRYWDARANVYLPVGPTEQLLSQSVVTGSQRFQEHLILFDRQRIIGLAPKGFDAEVGMPLFFNSFMEKHDVRAFGGFYHYQAESLPTLWGWKGRMSADVIPSINIGLEVAHDQVFKTNVAFNVQWTFGGFRQGESERKTQIDRMTTPVRRNYNVVVARNTVVDPNVVAINPATGLPYDVEHVNSGATGFEDGTVENPWSTIQEAQATLGEDIIFVHADSVFDNPGTINLESGVRVLGEANGVSHFVNVEGLGNILLPRATAGVNRPLIQNTVGDGVVLAANTEFSGFVVNNASGRGIFGTGDLGQSFIRSTEVTGSGLAAISLVNTQGALGIQNATIGDPDGAANALEVIGGNSTVTYSGTITNTEGAALLVQGMTGGSVNLTGSQITNTAGLGVQILNNASVVTVDTATINNAIGNAVLVDNTSRNITFRGPLSINNAGDDSILVQNTAAGTTVAFADLTNGTGVSITGRGGQGVNLNNNAGNIFFGSPLSIAGLGGAGDAAIDFQNNSGNATFQNVIIQDSASDGIRIGSTALGSENTGAFTVNGLTSITGNVTGNAIAITDDSAVVTFGNAATTTGINARGLAGISVIGNNANVSFLGSTSIGNPAGSTSPAIDIQDNTNANIVFGNVVVSNATGPANQGAGLNLINNSSNVSFNSLDITTIDGIGIFARNAASLTIADGFVDSTFATTGRSAIDIEDSGYVIVLDGVSADSPNGAGIRLVDNTGVNGNGNAQFVITGADPARDGGTIQNSTTDGIFLSNTGNVSLTGMTIGDNAGDGIFAQNLRQLNVFGSTTAGSIFTNGLRGIEALNVDVVQIAGMQLTNNGAVGTNNPEILLRANAQSQTTPTGLSTTAYQWLIQSNTITENGVDAIRIQSEITNVGPLFLTIGGPNNSSLATPQVPGALTSDGNTITLNTDVDGAAAVNVQWNNALSASAQWNAISITGANNGAERIGMRFATTSTTQPHFINVLDNTIISSRENTTGLDFVQGGVLNGVIARNTINFNSADLFIDFGRAMRFNIGNNSVLDITDNVITDNDDGSQGLLFESVGNGSTFFIARNDITFNNNFLGFFEEGIVFETVTGTVNFVGGENIANNNTVNFTGTTGTGTAFQFLSGTSTGSLRVNGLQIFP
jgi:hypothetical protein